VSEDLSELSAELRTAVARIYRRFRSERGDGELGDAALGVLIQLHKTGPHTLTELCEADRVTAGSMSQTIRRLETGGFIARRKDATDGRRVLIELTPAGERTAQAARAQSVSWLNARLAEFTEDERAVLKQAAALMRRTADT
jgi:DNA-binding MarR family transcriptional regulator